MKKYDELKRLYEEWQAMEKETSDQSKDGTSILIYTNPRRSPPADLFIEYLHQVGVEKCSACGEEQLSIPESGGHCALFTMGKKDIVERVDIDGQAYFYDDSDITPVDHLVADCTNCGNRQVFMLGYVFSRINELIGKDYNDE